MADLQHTIGAVIRRERKRRRRTMKDIASDASVSLVYLGEIERGKKYPSALVIERIAEALDIAVFDLLEAVAAELRHAQPAMTWAVGTRIPARESGTSHPDKVTRLTPLDARAA